VKLKCPKVMTGSRRGVLNETGIENLPSLLASSFPLLELAKVGQKVLPFFHRLVLLSWKLCSA
jgi:hypothetical protein